MDKKVSVNVKEQPLAQVLKTLLGESVTYKQEGSYILLSENADQSAPRVTQQNKTVKGNVQDTNGGNYHRRQCGGKGNNQRNHNGYRRKLQSTASGQQSHFAGILYRLYSRNFGGNSTALTVKLAKIQKPSKRIVSSRLRCTKTCFSNRISASRCSRKDITRC